MREQAYNHKPAPKFFGEGEVFLGVELEVEAPDADRKQRGLELERRPGWCYAKHDGSLGRYGWEMVTHPISVQSWLSREEASGRAELVPGTVLNARYKGQSYTVTVREGGRVEWNGTVYGSLSAAGKAIKGGKSTNGYKFFRLGRSRLNPVASFFRLVTQLKDLGYSSHDGGRCGFHVHISRVAFAPDGGLHNPMFFRFKSLINGCLFRTLSQRSTFNYCQQQPVDVNNFTLTTTKYSAVNVTLKTVEVRIFRGNLREDRVRKNIEAVLAALAFAQEATDYVAPTDEQFVAFVAGHAEEYPNLHAYINQPNHQGA